MIAFLLFVKYSLDSFLVLTVSESTTLSTNPINRFDASDSLKLDCIESGCTQSFNFLLQSLHRLKLLHVVV